MPTISVPEAYAPAVIRILGLDRMDRTAQTMEDMIKAENIVHELGSVINDLDGIWGRLEDLSPRMERDFFLSQPKYRRNMDKIRRGYVSKAAGALTEIYQDLKADLNEYPSSSLEGPVEVTPEEGVRLIRMTYPDLKKAASLLARAGFYLEAA